MSAKGAELAGRPAVLGELEARFPRSALGCQATPDGVVTVWVQPSDAPAVLAFLKREAPRPYSMLFDLTAIDERTRAHREGQPPADFSVVYHLMSFERNADLRVKVAVTGDAPCVPSVAHVWPAADWYEREAWDMFGIRFDGHPNLRRILMPTTWKGHPLRKDHPARATEMGPYVLPDDKLAAEQEALRFQPEDWGMVRSRDGADFMFLNIGPQHPGTHGVLRVVLQLDGEEIVDAVCDIGYHHRGAEKMGERQSWHTYIPYTDRVDYLSGVLNNLAYLTSLERMAGIDVPDRAKVARVLLGELFRISNHLVWYGTFAQDVGQLSPVFYMFNDRERILGIIEAVTGARMHPSWLRIGGLAADLPRGWDRLVRDFLEYMPPRLDEYESMVMDNRLFKARTKGIGKLTLDEAIDWGVSGPNLRSCGCDWDLRKKRPYSGYEAFDFDIPTATGGDCYDRAVVRCAEMRQSLRIIRQCLEGMPEGHYRSDHPLATPPRKQLTMKDIESLIHHFVGVSWGPVIPPGECMIPIESSKGMYGYYLVSDGSTLSYRTRIRSPSFAHMQVLRRLTRGLLVPDLLAILGSLDYVLADVDR